MRAGPARWSAALVGIIMVGFAVHPAEAPIMWPDRRLTDLFKTEHPIVLAPMAGAVDARLVIEVCEAGGLGSLPVAMLNEQQMRDQIATIRSHTAKPFNVNFFCHRPPELNNA